MMKRRKFLTQIVVVSTVGGLAGCISQSSSDLSTDDDPEKLLPEETNERSEDETTELITDEMDAEAGISAEYIDSEENEYFLEILRWPSQSDAESGVSGYRDFDWPTYVVKKNFSTSLYIDAVKSEYSADEYDKMYTLLAGSPYLTKEYVRNNNMIDS